MGHWTHPDRGTGCTVIIPDEPALAVADVRGGAPGTRETSLLEEGRLVQRVDAVLLTGGSAFGLAAAEGVVQWLREQGRGFHTASIPVPIVSAAVLFDLKGRSPVWPDADAGYAAAAAAKEAGWLSGQLGAGTGATIAKLMTGRGRPAGLGSAAVMTPAGTIAAIVAVNAVGEIAVREVGDRLEHSPDAAEFEERLIAGEGTGARPGENTTIGVVVIDAAASRDDLLRIGVAAHDGLARAIHPAHTVFDGDTFFVLGLHEGKLSPGDSVRLVAATQRSVMLSVARSLPG